MTIRNLEFAVRPTSVAVFGASAREGSVGRVVIDNIVNGGFEGEIWPVNPEIQGGRRPPLLSRIKPTFPAFPISPSSSRRPPPCRASSANSARRARGRPSSSLPGSPARMDLRQAMLDAAKPFLFRIIGPNTLGLMIPPIKLNASFAHMAARAGQHCAALAVGGDRDVADRLGGGKRRRLLADRVARRHGRCRRRRLPRHAGGRRQDPGDRHVSRIHP